jgi:AacA4 family aminoglycoside N(6')-acetyltransferase
MAIGHQSLTLRQMTDGDLTMLHGWLNLPHVAEWWGVGEAPPSLKDIQHEYSSNSLKSELVTAYIATLDNEPIGFAQSYVAFGRADGWWKEVTDPGTRGIDQFLALPSQLNQGVGTKLVLTLCETLFSDPSVTQIQTDPDPNNHRAIRCYEKAGFVQQKVVLTPDGTAMYMLRKRNKA